MRRLPLVDDLVPAVRELAPARPGDAPLWVLLPSARLVRELEQLLLEQAASCAGVHLLTPGQAVQRVLLERGAAPRPRASRAALLSWLGHEIADARRRHPLFLADDLDYLARYPAARRALLETLASLRLWQVGYGVELRVTTERGRALLSFLPQLERALAAAELDDPARRLERALALLQERHAGEPGHVLAFVPGPQDSPELVGLARTLGKRLEFAFHLPRPTADSGFLFGHGETPAAPLPQLEVFSAQGHQSELVEVAQRVRELIRRGVAPHRIAIAPARVEPYESIVAATLERERVPFTTTVQRPLPASPIATLAVRLVRLCAQDAPRGTLVSVLGDPAFAFQPAAGAAPLDGVGAFDRVTRDAGCLGGIDMLRQVLRLNATDETQVSARVRHSLARIRHPLESFLATLEETRSQLDAATNAHRQCEILGRLLDRFLVAAEGLQDAKDATLAQTATLGQRSRLGLGRIDQREVDLAVQDALAERTLPFPSSDPDGVVVLPLDRLRGQRFEHVFLIGMNRDQIPYAPPPHPYLSEADLTAIRDTLLQARRALPAAYQRASSPPPARAAETEQASREDLESLLLATSQKITVSFLRANAQGQPKTPSPWLRHLSHALLHQSSLPAVLDPARPWFESVPLGPPERIATRLRHGRAQQRVDVLLHAGFAGGPRALTRLAEALRPEWAEWCASAADWLETRDSFEPRAGDALRFDALGLGRSSCLDDNVSVSALAMLGECPLRFWLEHELRTEPLPDEPAADEVSRKHLGIAAHEVLHRVFAELRAAGLLTPESDPRRARATASRAIAREIGQARQALLSFQALRLPLLRDRALEAWQQTLERILALEFAEMEETGYRPIELEHSVERDLVVGDHIRLSLSGRLDRLDRAGQKLRIVDYKTGGFFEPDMKDIRSEPFKGKRLQLPIYAMLLKSEGVPFPEAELRGVAPELLAQCRQELPRRRVAPEIWSSLAGLEETLEVIASLLVLGDYPCRKSFACRWCAFRSGCPRNHPPSIDRVDSVERLRAFGRLDEKNSRRTSFAASGRSAGTETSP